MLELLPLTDRHALDALYADPYIARIGHDHRPAAPIFHPAARYVGAYIGKKLAGAFLIIESGFIECDVHALLTKRALYFSRALGHMLLGLLFSTNESLQRVTAYVIESLPSARNYCLKLGFKDEGLRRDCCMQNGVLLGVHTLGMTRNDWENL